MYRSLFSVGGFTLLSRVTGFARDMIISALLGATGLADAFFVAFKLPNLFRAVFGEGAFNTAYVPAYARILKTDGDAAARDFSGEVFAFLLVSQLALFAVFEIEAAHLVRLIAPGFAADPAKFAVTVALTRVTSPYLMLMTLAAQQSGTLNAHGKFAAAAFAPALLNFSMIGFLSAHRLFPDAAHAAAWGTLAAGFLQAGLVMIACARGGFGQTLRLPRFGGPLRRFFRALGPAVIGSAGVQIAIFADTIIASLLPTGSVSAINYADRLYQLPIGVIGVAAGVVLLPEMSKRLAVDDEAGAAAAQNRTLALSALLAAPFMVAFLFAPRALVDGVFRRGAFTAEDGLRAAAILRAYGSGLIAIVSIRSVVASFQARHDTRTPMLVSLAAIAANVALKLALYKPMGAAGLAAATAVGAWLNLAGLALVARRRGWFALDGHALGIGAATLFACGALALAAAATEPFATSFGAGLPRFGAEATLAIVAGAGGLAYVGALVGGLAIAGFRLSDFRRAAGRSRVFR